MGSGRLCLVDENQLNMGKGDPKKLRGKMSSYAFFGLRGTQEEAPGCFRQLLRVLQEMLREVEDHPPKGETKKKFKDPNAPKKPPSAFLFCSEYRTKIKGEHPGFSIGDVAKNLGEMWNNTAADDKQPYEKKAAKLEEKYEKDIAAYRAKGKPDAAKKGAVKAEKSKKKKEEEDDEENEGDEEEDEEEEDEDEEDDNNE
ncbi:high mobility group protein B1-like [Phodopus roborovskii]|uniref:high mobility group protein B1-like n=1 Tax=Phodopus roborovskii TaxID=109678 RepID=UPI0021E49011|nr:high mobility group protein B1-like [Phodopus roborovskii]